MENTIRNAFIKFEQEFMGGGPDEARALVARDLVVVRLSGVLTPPERQLAKTAEGMEMVKQLRQNLIAQGRDKLCEQVSEITGAKVLGLLPISLGSSTSAYSPLRPIEISKTKQSRSLPCEPMISQVQRAIRVSP